MRLYLIRHADPDYPNNTITQAGHLEARALAGRMKAMGLDYIYSSPLGRAVHTMQYTADVLGLPHAIEPWTAEIGDCMIETPDLGKGCVWQVAGEKVREKTPFVTADNWHTHELFMDPLLKQRFEKVREDSDAFFGRHGYQRVGGRYKIVAPNRHKIAVFCHGGFGLFWLAHLLELPLPLVWTGFHLPASSVTTVLFEERSVEWAVPRCTGVGDVSHLFAAGLPVQRAGILANAE